VIGDRWATPAVVGAGLIVTRDLADVAPGTVPATGKSPVRPARQQPVR
jgi:hypothetical protein